MTAAAALSSYTMSTFALREGPPSAASITSSKTPSKLTATGLQPAAAAAAPETEANEGERGEADTAPLEYASGG